MAADRDRYSFEVNLTLPLTAGMSDPSADPCRQRRSTMTGRHSSLFAPKFCPNPSRGAEVLAIEPIISSVVRFAKALYWQRYRGFESGFESPLTVLSKAFQTQLEQFIEESLISQRRRLAKISEVKRIKFLASLTRNDQRMTRKIDAFLKR